MRRLVSRILALPLLVGLALAPRPAAAWDPSTTHAGLVDQALRRSAVHLRWMAGSELTRGLFTPLRVDPKRLQPGELRLVLQAMERVSEATGSRALGGPGACPGEDAPSVSRRYCVDGERWQMSALGWIQLGVIAELVPSAREVHHFVDRDDPSALSWSDPELPRWLLRLRLSRHNGAPLAGSVNRTNFSGHGPSAIAWIADKGDLLAPPRLYEHLERAYLEPEETARAHHLAMALICVGALLHVAQDLAVPAHARGDVSAFFAPLSGEPGDRGLPLQELARTLYGRRDLPLPTDPAAIGAARGIPMARSILGHLLGEGGDEGLIAFAGRRFFSESSTPTPRYLEADLDPEAAAARLLEGAPLDPVEAAGARLSPWPAARGYLLSGQGRPLAAFDTDDEGRIRAFVDTTVYQDQMKELLPRAADVSRSLLDFVFPGWPTLSLDADRRALSLEVDADVVEPVLLVLHQDGEGKRSVRRKVSLTPGKRNRIADLPASAESERIVLVLRGRYAGGEPLLWEATLPAKETTLEAVPGPYVPPPLTSAEGEEEDEEMLRRPAESSAAIATDPEDESEAEAADPDEPAAAEDPPG